MTPPSSNNKIDQGALGSDCNPLANIGSVLSEARKSKGMSVEELAATLKIGAEQLIALENAEIDLLPEEVFVKAMIRRVAEKLDLDSLLLMNEFRSYEVKAKQIFAEENNKSDSSSSILTNFVSVKTLFDYPVRAISITSSIIIVSIIAYVLGGKHNLFFNKSYEVSEESKGYIINKRIDLIAIKPTRVKIRNSIGEIIFEGKMRKPLSFEYAEGVEVYSSRPDLIQIQKEGHDPISLGKRKILKWYSLNDYYN